MKDEYLVKRAKVGDLELSIYQDQDPESPRQWDNFGRMVCFHKRYDLGDKTDLKSEDFESWEDLHNYLKKELKAVIILPLFLYDHSGISIRVGSWVGKAQHAEWDSGQVGFIYATQEDLKNEGVDKKKAEDILRGEVETYNLYLTGEVFGFSIDKITYCKECGTEHKENMDSCWGFYGYDLKTNGIFDYIDNKKLKEAILKA